MSQDLNDSKGGLILDVDGKNTINDMIASVNKIPENNKPKGTITLYFTNDVPWIEKLEYGMYPIPSGGSWDTSKTPWKKDYRTYNGFSTQAHQGIRSITAMEWEMYVDQAIMKVKSSLGK
jgi:hypothetical protein